MRNILLLTIITFACIGVRAQVVLTSAQMPAIGTRYIYFDAETPANPFVFNKTDTANSWNFTAMLADSMNDDTVFIIDPATLQGSNVFPSATHAKITKPGESAYAALKVDLTGAYLVGGAGDITGTGSNIAIPYQSPITVYSFPYTMNTSVSSVGVVDHFLTGAEVGQSQFVDSVRLRIRTFATSTVVASGTLVLPSGSFPAILEVVRTTTHDSTLIKGSLTGGQWAFAPAKPDSTVDSTYNWYTNLSLLPYATVQYNNGIEDITYFQRELTGNVGIGSVDAENGTSLFPNPVQNMLNIEAVADGEFALYNISGTRVMSDRIHAGRNEVSTSSIPPGIYLLHLKGISGNKTWTIIKQ